MNTLQRYNEGWARPWSLLDQMERHMQSLLDTSDELPRGATEARFKDADSHYLMQVDLPGVGKDNIQINAHDGCLHIRGHRQSAEGVRSARHFEHMASLPRGVDAENIKAHYEHGVLTLAIPKLPEKSTKISIEEGKKDGLWSKLLNSKPAAASTQGQH